MAAERKFFTRRRFIVYGAMASVAAVTGVDAFFVEPAWVEYTKHVLGTAKLKHPIRIVQISDLHLDGDKRRDGVPERVNALNPDIIALTGDYTNDGRVSAFEKGHERVAGFAGRLRARYGVYATFGNWDGGIAKGLFEGTDVITLRGKTVSIDTNAGTVGITGLDHSWDYAVAAREAVGLADELDGRLFNLLLYHSPDIIEEVAETGKFDLYLCGHTHGGQVRVPFLDAIRYGFRKGFPYPGSIITLSRHGSKYDSGMFRVGGTHMYVCRGLGMEGEAPRIRFFCRPEIAVIDVMPA